ncbi:MAG: NAD(P)/FAD-dependent oxidoreductase [Candidatus Gracilibacteria bacterium]|jgi:hypothetical protein
MRIGIIGAGAAGLMAAAAIAENSGQKTASSKTLGHDNRPEVFLIDKNPILGRKVLISGGGRCNITTSLSDINQILKNYPRGSRFLKFAMHTLSPQKLCEWFVAHGLAIKKEKFDKIFPQSNNGEDVIKVFEQIFAKYGVEPILKAPISDIQKKNGTFTLQIKDGKSIEVDKLIITTGGQAFKQTGSVGDGYSFAEKLGHKITELFPSLHGFETKESWPTKIPGVSIVNARLKFHGTSKTYEFFGPFLFTHRGISGPAIFSISSLAAQEKVDQKNPKIISIDFLPQKNYENLIKEITIEIKNHPTKKLDNILKKYLPISLLSALNIVNKKPSQIAEILKNTKLTVTDKTAGEEFVTAGGVSTNEIDPKTMESKICPNLYFAGEILDIDGFTGGFNLQSAWCTGYLAGKNALNII